MKIEENKNKSKNNNNKESKRIKQSLKKNNSIVIDIDESIELAEFLKIFGDSTRIRIISVLASQRACVSDLTNILQMSQSSISHQLKILRDAKLVKYLKEGKMVYYELLDNHVRDIYEKAKEHINEK